ncbi:MAG: type II toxin-antitoxin system MqsA family antitoxin [Pseudomonadota bacterium]
MNIDNIVEAIEKDAGTVLPGLRESLSEMQAGITGRAYTPEQLSVRAARNKLGLSQQAFADLIKTPVATLRDWEQGRFTPPGAVLCLLQITLNHPELLRELAA